MSDQTPFNPDTLIPALTGVGPKTAPLDTPGHSAPSSTLLELQQPANAPQTAAAVNAPLTGAVEPLASKITAALASTGGLLPGATLPTPATTGASHATGDLLRWIQSLQARITQLESTIVMLESSTLETRVAKALQHLGGKL